MWDSCRKIWVKQGFCTNCALAEFARVSAFTFLGIEGRRDVSRQTHVAGSFTISTSKNA
jgi:hypothetical protein